MITLHSFGPAFGLPEVSPFCMKTEVQLQMAGLAYQKERATPPDSPKGQLPFITDHDARIADSTFIRAHIETAYGFDFDEGLDARGRAEAWAIERLLESQISSLLTYYRWLVPENFAKGPVHFFSNAPAEVREKLAADALARVGERVFGAGITRHNPQEIADLGDRNLDALATILGDQPYLMGGKPTGVDATAFAMLAGILTPFFDTPAREKALQLPNLVSYTARMMQRYYPGFDWQVGVAAPQVLRRRELAWA